MSFAIQGLALRALLLVSAVPAIGLVSSVCVDLHDAFVRYAMVAASICLALVLNALPLVAQVTQATSTHSALSLLRVIICADVVVFALSLAAAIVMSREIRIARLVHDIHVFGPNRVRCVQASTAFLWLAAAIALALLFLDLYEAGRCANVLTCEQVRTLARYSEEGYIDKPVYVEPPRREVQNKVPDPGAFAHAAAVPYV